MEGIGMLWPLAAQYARHGWAVRRAGWENPYMATGAALPSNSLRWIIYQNALFHLIYQEREADMIGARVIRPVLNTDFTESDFRADDWTVLTPSCLAAGGTGNPNQQGFQPYPQNGTESPFIDPQYPNSYFGNCPTVPPVGSASTTSGGVPGESPPTKFPDESLAPESDPQPPLPSGGTSGVSTSGGGGSGSGGIGGGGGGGGTGSGGGRSSRRKPVRPAAAPLSLVVSAATPACHVGENSTEEIIVTATLGAAPSAQAEGLYWVTVTVQNVSQRHNLSPGDSHAFTFSNIPGNPGVTEFIINGTAYLPIKRLTSRDSLRKTMNEGCAGYYLSLLCQSEPCHDGTGRLTVTSPVAGQVYQGCPSIGNVFIAGTLEADTEIDLEYDAGNPCQYHCCDNAVFGILLNRHIAGVSPDAFVSLGSINLNNLDDCGSRAGSVTVTQANLDALAAP